MSGTSDFCHDCGAGPGELHKADGDVTQCPYCGVQLISCDCGRRPPRASTGCGRRRCGTGPGSDQVHAGTGPTSFAAFLRLATPPSSGVNQGHRNSR